MFSSSFSMDFSLCERSQQNGGPAAIEAGEAVTDEARARWLRGLRVARNCGLGAVD